MIRDFKTYNRLFTAIFAVIVNILLSSAAVRSQTVNPDDKFPSQAARSITVVINLMMPDGRVMVYSGIRHGLRRDIIYEVFQNSTKIGEIRFEKITDDYSVGKIIGDPMKVFLEGKAVTLVEKPGTGPVVRYEPVDPNAKVKKLPPIFMKIPEPPKPPPKIQPVKPPPRRPDPPPPAPPPPAKIQRSSSYSLRYDTHSSESYPDYSYTLIASTSSKTKNHLTSLYGMYKRNDHGLGGSFPNSWGAGLSRTWFLPDAWYFTTGYNYSKKQKWYYLYPTDNETNSVSASFFKIIPVERGSKDFYKASIGYYVQSDFDTGESLSGSISYTHKMKDNAKLTLTWLRLYSIENSRQLYDQYGADYNFPVGEETSATLGYRFLDMKRYPSGYDPDDDENFRLTLSKTVK